MSESQSSLRENYGSGRQMRLRPGLPFEGLAVSKDMGQEESE